MTQHRAMAHFAADRSARPAPARPLGRAQAPAAASAPALRPAALLPQAPPGNLPRPAPWRALGLSAALHAGAVLALIAAAPFAGTGASGEGGQETVSLPAPPAMSVELLTPADLVSDIAPEVPAMVPPGAFAAPAAPPDPAPVAAPDPAPPQPLAAPALAVLSSETSPAVETAVPPPPEPEPEPEPVRKVEAPKPEKAAEKPAEKTRADKKKQPAAVAPSPGGARAAGAGGGGKAGSGGKTAEPGASKAQAADLKAAWGAKIQARIERRRVYPRDAGGAEGVVRLELTVAPSGALLGVAVTGSSGSAALDRAAVKAVKSAGRFAKAPAGLTQPSYTFSLRLNYEVP